MKSCSLYAEMVPFTFEPVVLCGCHTRLGGFALGVRRTEGKEGGRDNLEICETLSAWHQETQNFFLTSPTEFRSAYLLVGSCPEGGFPCSPSFRGCKS